MDSVIFRGEEEDLQRDRVKLRAVDVEGRPIGQTSNTPMLDTRQYVVKFLVGEKRVYTANIIAENLLCQVDKECHRQMMINEIVDHQVMEEAIPILASSSSSFSS